MDCGHGCKISCPDGGGCAYYHGTGECITFCNGDDGKLKFMGEGRPPLVASKDLETTKVDVSFHDVTAAELQKALRAMGLA